MAEEKDVILDVQNLKMYFRTAKGFNKQTVKAVDDVVTILSIVYQECTGLHEKICR